MREPIKVKKITYQILNTCQGKDCIFFKLSINEGIGHGNNNMKKQQETLKQAEVILNIFIIEQDQKGEVVILINIIKEVKSSKREVYYS